MSWDIVQQYIEALPEEIELGNKNEDVTFCGRTLPVMQAHNLFVQTLKSNSNDKIVEFLNKYLRRQPTFTKFLICRRICHSN